MEEDQTLLSLGDGLSLLFPVVVATCFIYHLEILTELVWGKLREFVNYESPLTIPNEPLSKVSPTTENTTSGGMARDTKNRNLVESVRSATGHTYNPHKQQPQEEE